MNITEILETTSNYIQSVTDGEKPTLHVGEVMSCWTYLSFLQDIINYENVALNTSTDKELVELFEEGINIARSHEKQLMDLLKQEGIPLPDGPQAKPISDPNAIPMGVKFTDKELANALAINIAYVATLCAQAAIQALRNDIGLMFFKFLAEKTMLGAKVKTTMHKRGWLKLPPPYLQPGLMS